MTLGKRLTIDDWQLTHFKAGADLSRLDLRNINFKYANMRGCDLTGANLSWSNLERVDLSQGTLDGAVM